MSLYHPGQVEILYLSVEQVQTLASAACSDVFSAFSVEEPLSIREVSLIVERSTASVGEHVAALLRCGLIIPCGQRKRRSRQESLYVKKGVITRWSTKDATAEGAKAYQHRFRAQLRLAEREFEAAQQAILADPAFAPYVLYRWRKIAIQPKDIGRLRQAILSFAEAVESLSESPSTENDDGLVRATLTTLLLPTIPTSRKRTGN